MTNPEKMLFNELGHAFDTRILLHSSLIDDLTYTIRANFGIVIIALIFEGTVEQRGDNLPWVSHYETKDSLKAIIDKDPLDFTSGYPNLKKRVRLVLPDIQGPLDSLELL